MKNKIIVLLIVMALLIGALLACTKEEKQNSLTKTEQTKQSTEVPGTENTNDKIAKKKSKEEEENFWKD